MRKELMDLVKKILPPWAEVIEGREVEALLDAIAQIAQEALLEGVLEWISHPEHLLIRTEVLEGCFKVTAEYRGYRYEAIVEVNDEGLRYLKPWEEVMD
jgi:hypothetical protein